MGWQGDTSRVAPEVLERVDAAGMDCAWEPAPGGPTVAVDATRIGLFAESGDKVHAWTEVTGVRFPGPYTIVITLQGGAKITAPLGNRTDAAEIATRLPGGLREGAFASVREHSARGPAFEPRRPANGNLTMMLVAGVIGQVLAGVVVGASWGSEAGLIAGMVLASLASIALGIAIVGLGVKWGMRAYDEG